jgi:hypothetical protein
MSLAGFNPNATLLTANPAAEVHVYSGGAAAAAVELTEGMFHRRLLDDGFDVDALRVTDAISAAGVDLFLKKLSRCDVAGDVFCTAEYSNPEVKKRVLSSFRTLFAQNPARYEALKIEAVAGVAGRSGPQRRRQTRRQAGGKRRTLRRARVRT